MFFKHYLTEVSCIECNSIIHVLPMRKLSLRGANCVQGYTISAELGFELTSVWLPASIVLCFSYVLCVCAHTCVYICVGKKKRERKRFRGRVIRKKKERREGRGSKKKQIQKTKREEEERDWRSERESPEEREEGVLGDCVKV